VTTTRPTDRSPLALCTRDDITVRGHRGPLRVEGAARFLDFACHHDAAQRHVGWKITHLPTGCAIASAFPSEEAAAGCMIEIMRLRNDWAVIDEHTLTKDLVAEMCRLILRFQGVSEMYPERDANKLRSVIAQSMNGYDSEMWKKI
jgi:hypothetical protein